MFDWNGDGEYDLMDEAFEMSLEEDDDPPGSTWGHSDWKPAQKKKEITRGLIDFTQANERAKSADNTSSSGWGYLLVAVFVMILYLVIKCMLEC